jgi:hypothetical protein
LGRWREQFKFRNVSETILNPARMAQTRQNANRDPIFLDRGHPPVDRTVVVARNPRGGNDLIDSHFKNFHAANPFEK